MSWDHEAILGPIPGCSNGFSAVGVSVGIASGGGVGKAMAEWIVDGKPELDLWPFDVRRFGDH